MTSDTMQAAVLRDQCAPFHIGPVSRPEPAQGQVLVRIKASAVNPLDLKIRKGEAAHAAPSIACNPGHRPGRHLLTASGRVWRNFIAATKSMEWRAAWAA